MNRKSKKKKKVKKPKRKLTAAEKRAKKERRKKYKWVFMNGKQVRVKREDEPTIDGIPQDEWIRNNACPIWLVQNEMWEYIDPEYFDPPTNDPPANAQPDEPLFGKANQIENDIPF